jgi:hypothetical protein
MIGPGKPPAGCPQRLSLIVRFHGVSGGGAGAAPLLRPGRVPAGALHRKWIGWQAVQWKGFSGEDAEQPIACSGLETDGLGSDSVPAGGTGLDRRTGHWTPTMTAPQAANRVVLRLYSPYTWNMLDIGISPNRQRQGAHPPSGAPGEAAHGTPHPRQAVSAVILRGLRTR